MAIVTKQIPLGQTDPSGAFTRTVSVGAGVVRAVGIGKGNLADTADVTVVDTATGGAIIALTNVLASGRYQPQVPLHDAVGAALAASGEDPPLFPARLGSPVVTRQVTVTVAEGGDTKQGTLYLVLER